MHLLCAVTKSICRTDATQTFGIALSMHECSRGTWPPLRYHLSLVLPYRQVLNSVNSFYHPYFTSTQMVQTHAGLLCIWGTSLITLRWVSVSLSCTKPDQTDLLIHNACSCDIPVCHSSGWIPMSFFPAADSWEHRLLRVYTEHTAQWKYQHRVCRNHRSQPADVASFILSWQGKDSSGFHTWNGRSTAESSRMVSLLPGYKTKPTWK